MNTLAKAAWELRLAMQISHNRPIENLTVEQMKSLYLAISGTKWGETKK